MPVARKLHPIGEALRKIVYENLGGLTVTVPNKERLAAYPGLTAVRFKEREYAGGYSVLRDCVRDLRPPRTAGFEVRFETPPGEQAQVDFAHIPPHDSYIPPTTKVVTVEQWRAHAYKRGLCSSGEPDTKKHAFRRAFDCLAENHRIAVSEPYVWPL